MKKEYVFSDVLDAVGLYCPAPLALATEKIKELKEGSVLKIEADDPMVLEHFPLWCKKCGHRFLKVEREADRYTIYIRKGRDREVPCIPWEEGIAKS
jgi:TusA-related sulfurtransferase